TSIDEESEDNIQISEKYQIALNELIDKLKKIVPVKKENVVKILESLQMDKKQQQSSIIIFMAASYNKVSKEKRVYLKYQLPYFGNVCSLFFKTFWRCQKNALYRLRKWVKKRKSMLPPPHGNIGRISANILPVETINNTKSFIREIGKQNDKAVAVQKYTQKKTSGQVTVTYEK
ncbi:7592_t:CDS:2, partial [Racocetra fulgida]